MKLAKLIAILTIFFSSCCGENVLERKLHTNPIEADIGRYSYLFQDLDKEIKKAREKIREAGVYLSFDVAKNYREKKLVQRLEEQIAENFRREDLLIVFTGAIHTNGIYDNLKDNFNVFFFSEPSYLEDESSFLTLSPFLLAQYRRKPAKQELTEEKPNAIVYGDCHSKDFDFSSFFPSIAELKDMDIKRILLAYERLNGKITLDSFKKHLESVGQYPNYKNLVKYLSATEASGIEVKVIGFGS